MELSNGTLRIAALHGFQVCWQHCAWLATWWKADLSAPSELVDKFPVMFLLMQMAAIACHMVYAFKNDSQPPAPSSLAVSLWHLRVELWCSARSRRPKKPRPRRCWAERAKVGLGGLWSWRSLVCVLPCSAMFCPTKNKNLGENGENTFLGHPKWLEDEQFMHISWVLTWFWLNQNGEWRRKNSSWERGGEIRPTWGTNNCFES